MTASNKNVDVQQVFLLLEQQQGKVNWEPRLDPVSELVFTILSQHSSDTNSIRSFQRLWDVFESWEQVMEADTEEISEVIWSGGLANIKGPRIKSVLLEIKDKLGQLDLSSLSDMSLTEAKEWLRSLSGVGPKTAAVVLCFGLGMPAMPVDTHIYRVSKRLGLISHKTTVDQAHEILESAVRQEQVFPFHVYLIQHGRQVCRARNPRCGVCVLNGICLYVQRGRT